MIKLSTKERAALIRQLAPYIEEQKLYVQYDRGKYCNVEAFEYAGSLMNLSPIVADCYNVPEPGDKIKYKAEVWIKDLDKDQEVARAMAIASTKEPSLAKFGEHNIASMATTRATGKAYRLLIGYLFKEMGYEGTPAEEMNGEEEIEISQIAEIRELLKHDAIPEGSIESTRSVMMHFDVARAENCIKYLNGIIEKHDGKKKD